MPTALQIVERDFPIPSSQDSLAEAALLREACSAVQCREWLIALALHLEDTTALAGCIFYLFQSFHKGFCLATLPLKMFHQNKCLLEDLSAGALQAACSRRLSWDSVFHDIGIFC